MMDEIAHTTLADVMRRNTNITGIPDNIFVLPVPLPQEQAAVASEDEEDEVEG